MACSVISGPRVFGGKRDREGQRTFTAGYLVKGVAGTDGPYNAMHASGLPTIGSFWSVLGETDVYAYCTPECSVSVHGSRDGHKPQFFKVDLTFSTHPFERCQDESIEDPLLEPQKVSGGFTKFTEMASEDKDGKAIVDYAGQPIMSSDNEWDANRPNVRIEQNVATLGLETFAEMIDTVNDSALWGLAARKIKLSNVSWSRLVYGTCNYYYKRTFEFDINFNTFDRDVLPKSTLALGSWSELEDGSATWEATDYPQRYFAKGKSAIAGQPTKIVLNTNGSPWPYDANGDLIVPTPSTPPTIKIQKYAEKDFTLLGIPLSF